MATVTHAAIPTGVLYVAARGVFMTQTEQPHHIQSGDYLNGKFVYLC